MLKSPMSRKSIMIGGIAGGLVGIIVFVAILSLPYTATCTAALSGRPIVCSGSPYFVLGLLISALASIVIGFYLSGKRSASLAVLIFVVAAIILSIWF